VIVPVLTPPTKIDAANVAAFAQTVREGIGRYGCLVIDCSEVQWIAACGMNVLEMAARDGSITLVNPNPTIHLMAATFGGDVLCRDDRATSSASVSEVPTRRLVSVHADGRVAS